VILNRGCGSFEKEEKYMQRFGGEIKEKQLLGSLE
jgi:hypothetical protein